MILRDSVKWPYVAGVALIAVVDVAVVPTQVPGGASGVLRTRPIILV